MSLSKSKPVVILGAGLAGSLLACFLSQRGYQVKMYEGRGDMRKTQMSAGRSINLALSTRGITALEKVGMKEEVMSIAIPMRGRMMHSKEKTLTYQPYSKDGKSAIFSVSRGDLNCRLMTLAEKRPGVEIFFNHKCTNVDLKKKEVTLRNADTNEETKVTGATILGCDGAFSKVRAAMMKTPRFDYSQSYLTHGYKELSIPPGPNGEHLIDKNCLHIWPRGSLMMIALPNLDGSFTVTCFFPFEGPNGFDTLDSADDARVMSFFETEFPDAIPLLPDLLKEWRENPTSALVTIKCFPWSYGGVCTLFGDASHAIVPFFGQGMNAAFEDCHVFDSIMEECKDSNWAEIFSKYQNSRKENADAIATLALENFVEMRDSVANEEFLFKKKVQNLLGNEFPQFNSRYELVSFSNIPYKEAIRIGELNDKITSELMKDAQRDINKIDLKRAKELIELHLK